MYRTRNVSLSWWTHLNRIRVCLHIRMIQGTPSWSFGCQLCDLLPNFTSILSLSLSLSLSLHGFPPRRFQSPPPSFSGRSPTHGHSWDGRQGHSVEMSNPSPSYFVSIEIGSIPIRWRSSVSGYFVWSTDA